MRISSWASTALLAVLVGCGDELANPGGDADGVSASSSTLSDGSTTSGPAATDGSEVEDGAATGDEEVVYSARAIIGGLDRVEIRKADYVADLCVWLTVVRPGQAGPFADVTIPAGWAIEQIAINDAATTCEQDGPGLALELATHATGSLAFESVGAADFPCTIDLDVDASFPVTLPRGSAEVRLQATDLAVDGTC